MSATSMLLARVKAELSKLVSAPPPGVSCWPVGDSMVDFEAVIIGADETPYEKGEFKVSLTLPARYPMEPPRCLFKTKVYHPNIDEGGRICLDILNLPPKGSWKPSLNISTVLISLRLLLSHPNPEDPLVAHISEQFVADYEMFARTAKSHTQQHAMGHAESSMPSKPAVDAPTAPTEDSKDSAVPPPTALPTSPRTSVPAEPLPKATSSLKRLPTSSIDEETAPSPKKLKPTEEAVPPPPPFTAAPFVPPKRVSLGGPRKKPATNPQ